MSKEELERWEQVQLEQGLAGMADIVYCRRCSTPCLEDKDNCAQCPKCLFVFCSICEESWHPGTQVMVYEGRLVLAIASVASSSGPQHASDPFMEQWQTACGDPARPYGQQRRSCHHGSAVLIKGGDQQSPLFDLACSLSTSTQSGNNPQVSCWGCCSAFQWRLGCRSCGHA